MFIMNMTTRPARTPETSTLQAARAKVPAVGGTEAGSFGEYFRGAEELLENFSLATRLPVRLIVAGAAFEMPPSPQDVCRQARELSDTAVECLRFHKELHTCGNGTEPLRRAVCRNGLLSGVMTIEAAGRALARVEVGPVPIADRSTLDPGLRVIEYLVGRLREQAAVLAQTTAPAAPAVLRKAIDHIRENLDQAVTLADSARVAALSPDRFSRVFRQHTGKSFSAYVAGLRVERACRMLGKLPHARISDIAMDCGFESIPYFNRLFIRHTGLTPGCFRTRTRIG